MLAQLLNCSGLFLNTVSCIPWLSGRNHHTFEHWSHWHQGQEFLAASPKESNFQLSTKCPCATETLQRMHVGKTHRKSHLHTMHHVHIMCTSCARRIPVLFSLMDKPSSVPLEEQWHCPDTMPKWRLTLPSGWLHESTLNLNDCHGEGSE